MKVIFLDIDGVLNCDTTPNPRQLPYVVDKRLKRRFDKLLGRTKAKVVLVSSWRVDPIGRYAARYYGIPVYDCTSDLPKAERHTEIRRWLRSHPSVSRYAVLDDEGDELDGLPLFQPSSKTGLTTDMAKAMERYLNGASDETRPAGVIRQVIDDIHARLTRDKR